MSRGRRSVGLLAVVAAVSLAGPAHVQAQNQPWSSAAGSGTAGVVLDHYGFSDVDVLGMESLSLLTVPVAGYARLGSRVDLSVSTAWARGALALSDGTDVEISGLTDTRVELASPVAGDAVVVSAVVDLPTGKSTHSLEEAFVAGAVAADLLPFRISHWGSGGGAGGSVAVAQPLGLFGVGASVGYFVSREFEPREGQSLRYQPGNVLRINAVVDRSLGDSKAAFRVSYQDYSEDLLDDQNLFRTGDRLELMGSWSFPVSRRASGILYGSWLMRDGGTALGTAGTALGATVATQAQDVFQAGAGFELPAGGGTLHPRARLRLVRPEEGPGQGWVGEIGASGAWGGGNAAIGPTVALRFGSIDGTADTSTTFVGAELGLSLRTGR